ncbi:MAG: transcription elongation factor [Gillisia sp.]
MVPNKTRVFLKTLDEINEQIKQYKEEMDNIRESMEANDVHTDYDEEGSKGELLADFEKYAGYLNNAQKMKETLQRIDREHYSETIQFGSVVETKNRFYFVAVPLGKITMDDESTVNVISTEAPIFEKLKGKKKGDTFTLKDEEVEILGVH